MPNQISFYPQSGAMMLLQELVLSAPTTSVGFGGVSQSYKHLRLVGNFSVTEGANLQMNFNGDTTAAHYAYGLNFQSQAANSVAQSNSAATALIAASAGAVTIDIPNYTAGLGGGVNWTGNFSTMSIGSNTLSGSVGGLWVGTDVSSIVLTDSVGGSFAAGSIFTLYGLN